MAWRQPHEVQKTGLDLTFLTCSDCQRQGQWAHRQEPCQEEQDNPWTDWVRGRRE